MSLAAASQLPTIPGAILRMSSIGLVVDCTYCGLAISLTICQSDKHGNAGKPMAIHPKCKFYKFFPELLQYPDILTSIPSSSSSPTIPPTQPPPWTQPAPSSFIPPSNGKQLRRKGSPCEGDFCRKPRALRCTRRMCLKHCVSEGGCAIHSQVSKDCENTDGTDRDHDFEFGNGLDELQQALQVSMAAQPSVPLHIPSIHELMGPVLSGPAASQQVTAPLQAPLEPPSMSHPPSAAQPARKQPRITNQLDPTWARDLRARAQQEIEEGRTAERRKEMERGAKQRFVLNWFDADDEPVNIQWVSHCPFFPQYQLADDPTLVESLGTGIERVEVYEERLARWIPAPLTHTFTLTSECHIFVRRYGVTRCEGFSDLYMASRALVRPAHIRFNMKGERSGVRAKLKYKRERPAIVSSDSESDVEIVEGESLTLTATEKRKRQRESSPRHDIDAPVPSRPRLGLGPTLLTDVDFADRRAVSMSPTPPFVDRQAVSMSPTPPFVDRRAVSPSPSRSSSPLWFPSTPQRSTSPVEFLSSPSLLSPSSPSPPLATSTGPSLSITSVHVPSYDPDNKRVVWPHGMYTIDMAAGFRQLDDPTLRGVLRQEELFERIFGVPYVKATYHQNHWSWIEADPKIREAHEQEKYAAGGLWKHFMRAHRIATGKQSKKSNKSRSKMSKS